MVAAVAVSCRAERKSLARSAEWRDVMWLMLSLLIQDFDGLEDDVAAEDIAAHVGYIYKRLRRGERDVRRPQEY